MKPWIVTLVVALFLCTSAMWAQNKPAAAKSVSVNVVVNLPHKGANYYVPVKVQVSSDKLASAKADTHEKQVAYVTRVLNQNADLLPVVTEDLKHYEDVRLYVDVEYDPGPGAHLHSAKGIQAARICGRLCCKNSDGKQCCAVIICNP